MAEPLIYAYRCSATGVLYPEDYIREWGKKYNNSAGLGPTPISEALVSDYHMPIAESRNSDQTMHPLRFCRAQVDLVQVTEAEFKVNAAILHEDDLDYHKRATIMRDNQLDKSPNMQRMFPEQVAAARERKNVRIAAGSKI